MSGKTFVIYEGANPKVRSVAYVAIQTETVPPYVYCVYGKNDARDDLPDDIAVIPKKAALNLFEFKSGKIEKCKRR